MYTCTFWSRFLLLQDNLPDRARTCGCGVDDTPRLSPSPLVSHPSAYHKSYHHHVVFQGHPAAAGAGDYAWCLYEAGHGPVSTFGHARCACVVLTDALSGRSADTLFRCCSKGERVIYCNSRSVFLRSITGAQPSVAYAGHVKDSQ